MSNYALATRIPRCCAQFLVLGMLGLGGCVYPHIDRSLPLQDAPLFTVEGEEEVSERWWETLGTPQLDYQIENALGENFSLDAAWERVIESRALAWREATDLYPDLNGVADAGGAFVRGRNRGNFALGLDASYQVDLWGRIRSAVEAERLRADSSMADYQSAALFLSAEIASTWFALVEAHAQLALVNQQIETNERGQELLEARFAGGEPNSSADVLRQRQLVDSTREQSVLIQARIELIEHQLAILNGEAPQNATYDVGIELPALPALPSTGLPSELLQRRPDVRRDFLSIMAADQDVASAISAQYPRLDLTASLATAVESPENLFRNWIGSMAGQLVAPLFDAGQRRSDVMRTAAILRQRVAEYGQTVLFAFTEVEDALAREKYANERLLLIESQIESAKKSSEILGEQYITVGNIDYLSVLTAIRDEQRLQRALLSTRLELVLARIELYRALSGDFDFHPPPPLGDFPPDVSTE